MTDDSRENLDLQRRICAALDGELAAQDRAELDRDLLRAPRARQWMEQVRALDGRAADALAAALAPRRESEELRVAAGLLHLARPRARRVRWSAVAAAAAMLLAIGAGLWFGPGLLAPGARPGENLAQTPTPVADPTPVGAVEDGRHLLLDAADISPLQDTPRRGDRFINRQYFGVFDEGTRELYLVEVDRVRTREDTEYLDW